MKYVVILSNGAEVEYSTRDEAFACVNRMRAQAKRLSNHGAVGEHFHVWEDGGDEQRMIRIVSPTRDEVFDGPMVKKAS